METSHRSVLVTGTSSGIGRATALLLSKQGFTVFAGVRNQADADDLRKADPRLQPVLLDTTSEPSVQMAARQISDAVGSVGLYGLVNNAGVSFRCPLELVPPAEMLRVLTVNTVGPLIVTQTMLPIIRRSGGGRLVFVSSISGRVTYPYMGAYAASKYGLEAVADAFRNELAHQQIRVSVIEPGNYRSEIVRSAFPLLKRVADNITAPELRDLYPVFFRGIELASKGQLSPPRSPAPEPVACAISRALTSRIPRRRYLLGQGALKTRLLYYLPSFVADWVLRRDFKRGVKTPGRRRVLGRLP